MPAGHKRRKQLKEQAPESSGAVFVGGTMKKDYSKEPWWNALTKEQREQAVAYLEENGEQSKELMNETKNKKKYKDVFGWG